MVFFYWINWLLRDPSFQSPSAPGPAQPMQPGYPASSKSVTCSKKSIQLQCGTQQIFVAGSLGPKYA